MPRGGLLRSDAVDREGAAVHPTLGELLAHARLQDDHSRLPQPREPRLLPDHSIVLRPARAEDVPEIAQWGEAPAGPVIVAEVDGVVTAAAAVGGEEIVAHPTR